MRFRQLRPDNWPPKQLHYEFVNAKAEVGVEIHLESDDVRYLADTLRAMSGMELLPGLILEWDPNWRLKRGRLMARLAKDESPEKAAQAMTALIEKTRPIIEAKMKQRIIEQQQ